METEISAAATFCITYTLNFTIEASKSLMILAQFIQHRNFYLNLKKKITYGKPVWLTEKLKVVIFDCFVIYIYIFYMGLTIQK